MGGVVWYVNYMLIGVFKNPNGGRVYKIPIQQSLERDQEKQGKTEKPPTWRGLRRLSD
jgi:hypothetical protein